MWKNPLPYTLIATHESNSFIHMPPGVTGIPIEKHVGAFGISRKHDIHTGVDIYVPKNTPVLAIEPGVVIKVEAFTGALVNMPWWENTYAIYVKGSSGVILYGELLPNVVVGDEIKAGDKLGIILNVLKKDKGRPMSMLHLELHKSTSNTWYMWTDIKEKPPLLLNPTPYLLNLCKN